MGRLGSIAVGQPMGNTVVLVVASTRVVNFSTTKLKKAIYQYVIYEDSLCFLGV